MTNVPVELKLAHRFIAASSSEEELPEPPLENVVVMSGQYRWLAEQAGHTDLELDPGTPGTGNTYAVQPFRDFLDELLEGLVDPGITYSAELFRQDHTIQNGAWSPGFGHVFKLLADSVPVLQDARIGSSNFTVEILISVEVVV